MKKIIISLLILSITIPAVYAAGARLYEYAYEDVIAGTYICPETPEPCKITKDKTGEIKLQNKSCKEDPQSRYSKYVPMIMRKQCKYEPDRNKYYYCAFSDALCKIKLDEKGNTTTTCLNKDKDKYVSDEELYKREMKIIQAIQKNYCVDRYSPEGEATYNQFIKDMRKFQAEKERKIRERMKQQFLEKPVRNF